jgi:hypothetical protein
MRLAIYTAVMLDPLGWDFYLLPAIRVTTQSPSGLPCYLVGLQWLYFDLLIGIEEATAL